MKVELNYNLENMLSSADSLRSVLEHIILFSENNEEIRTELDKIMAAFRELKGGEQILRKALREVETNNENYIIENKIMARFTFTKEDFYSEEPYAFVFSYASDRFRHDLEMNKMAEEAKKAGYTGFKKSYQAYLKSLHLKNAANVDRNNPSDFPDQPIELECGQWLCDANGVKTVDGTYGTVQACCHPIMPVERLVNIDTFEEKVNLAFYKSKRWRNIIVSKEITAVASKITNLAARGIAVTSENAKALVKYLCDIENMNLDIIPEHESVSRLGYVDEGRFSPYVDGLIFDGDAAYSNIFNAIKEPKGDFDEWLKIAKKCRSESMAARIMISASFASVLVQKVGNNSFVVHLWSCESGTGKTVALMVAASVWGDPELGVYIQSFNSTAVGHERMAAFLNNIPMCIDELQLAKDNHGNSRADVYQLAQGFGRTRGNKIGGVDKTPTWRNSILTTGETPIVREGSGAGAEARVIDLEVPMRQKVISDGRGVANAVRKNYGYAGRKFIENADFDRARELYKMYAEKLDKINIQVKQSGSAAIILAADALVSEMFFDEKPMEVSDIQNFLKTNNDVSLGDRGYKYICDWVAINIKNFISNTDMAEMPTKIYGMKDGSDWIYINQSVFKQAVEEGGYNSRALLSSLKSKGLIQTRAKSMTKDKRIAGVHVECVVLKLPDAEIDPDEPVEII